jgi:hypothetical protein
MTTQTIESRVAYLEAELLRMNELLRSVVKDQGGPKVDEGDLNWIDRAAGSISDEALFLKALEYGRQHRQKSS